MDVRCERCRAQYVFDDAQVTPSGLTVQCTNCGHVFKVKKKELVVTVPVKPEEMRGNPPVPASAVPRSGAAAAAASDAAARSAEPERPKEREWRVRQGNGNVFTFKELTTLQKWIVEQKVSRDDEISLSGDQWKRLGNIAELASFFQVVEAAERAKLQAGMPAATPVRVSGIFGAPAPSAPPARAAGDLGTTTSPPAIAPAARAREAVASEDVALSDDELRPVRPGGGRGVRALAAVLALVAAGAAAAWRWAPELLGLPRRGAPGAASAAELHALAASAGTAPPATADAAAPAAPVPTPQPVADAPAPRPAEPLAPTEPPKPAAAKVPKGAKALVAQAERLRDRGDTERALDLYGRAVDQEPDNADALAGRGLCYLDLSQYAPAEASFQAAIRANPQHAEALLGLAETYRWQGKKTEAIKYYERVLALHPGGEEAEVARNAIQKLKE